MSLSYRHSFPGIFAAGFAVVVSWMSVVLAEPDPGKFTVPEVRDFRMNASGVFRVDGLGFEVIHFDDNWKKTLQKDLARVEGYPRLDASANTWETRGTLAPGSTATLHLAQALTPLSPASFRAVWEASVDAPGGIPTREVSLQCDIPISRYLDRTFTLDGSDYRLPATLDKQNIFAAPTGGHTLTLPTAGGSIVITGNYSVVLQDNRKWSTAARTCTLRIRFSPQRSPLKKATLDVTFRYEPAPAGSAYAPSTIAPGPDWAPYVHSLDIEPGSIFDFSSRLDAPAGKYGSLRATPEGRFEFAGRPGHPVRFQGVNLTFGANFPATSADADLIAERLARSGYNTVRFHHIERHLVRKGGPSYELDPDALDQLETLFAALKRRGIYINIDLYSARSFTREELASFGLNPQKNDEFTKYLFKGIVPVSDAAFDNWSRYAKNLLTHRNPHTGLTWAEDPVLIGICPVNEDSAYLRADHPSLAPLYRAAWERDKDASWREQPHSADPEEDYNRFVVEVQIRSDRRNAGFLRNLGCQALVTGANHRNALALVPVRQQFDYVDNHQYLDHPRFPGARWGLPFAFAQESATRQHARLPRLVMPTRILGKPFAVTEFNYVRPNRHRAEGSALLMPAYASLQDWSALYNFQYAMDRQTALAPGVDNYFSLTCDPLGLIADRVGSLLFQRHDIAAAPGAIVFAVRPEDVAAGRTQSFPEEFSRLGLVMRIGSRYAATPADIDALAAGDASVRSVITYPQAQDSASLAATLQRDGVLPAGSVDPSGNRYRSETGEIELDVSDGTVRVVTPRSELFLLKPGKTLVGGRVTVAGDTPSMVGVIAMDSPVAEPLAGASRILVIHLTDTLPEGITFANASRQLLESWGRLPHLVQRGAATLTLRLSPGAWQAWAVDSTGKRVREIPLRQTAPGAWTFTAATITPEGTQLAWELARPSA